MHRALEFDESIIFSPELILVVFSDLSLQSLIVISPILGVTLILAFLAAYSIGGIGFSFKAFLPKFSKLNPITGLGRMFGSRGLIELIKSIAKLVLIASVITAIIYSVYDRVFFLNLLSPKLAVESGLDILAMGILLVTLTLLCIAAIDLPYQVITFRNNKDIIFDDNLRLYIDVDLYYTLKQNYGMPKIIKNHMIANRSHSDQDQRKVTEEEKEAEIDYIVKKHNLQEKKIF